jgi:hypothetical protein
MERVMEFFEAPTFTRHLARYLEDEQYRTLQNGLASTPELGDLIPGRGDFASSAGPTFAGVKAGAADCASSITGSTARIGFGS